jgi:hypothetical protein
MADPFAQAVLERAMAILTVRQPGMWAKLTPGERDMFEAGVFFGSAATMLQLEIETTEETPDELHP